MKHQLKINDTVQLNGIVESKLRIVGIAYDFVSEFGQIIVDRNLPVISQTQGQLHGVGFELIVGGDSKGTYT